MTRGPGGPGLRSGLGHVFDVVVVGAGGSGAPLAARLSEDPDCRVLLLEAGPVPSSIAGFDARLLDARAVPGAQPDGPVNQWFPMRLTPGHDHAVARGRVLGGSTTTNGGYFIRARRADFDDWAVTGGPAWSYDGVLPLLMRLETDLDFGAPIHGTGPHGTGLHGTAGPMPVSRSPIDHPAAAAFVEAAAELGFPAEPDKNEQGPEGVGPVPMNVRDGRRVNTGLAYVLPVVGRRNLVVRQSTRVLRVRIECGRAMGVEVERHGHRETIVAGTTVLAAGALASAHLLLLSGIGPAAQLAEADVRCLVDAPSVGTCFGDHPQVVLDWRPHSQLPPSDTSWLGAALHTDGSEVLQSIESMPALMAGRRTAPGEPLPLLLSAVAPASRGRLRLVSDDPSVLPRIDSGYLAEAADRAVLRDGVRMTLELLATGAFRTVGAPDPELPSAAADDGTLDAWIAAHVGTSVHTCGSVPFGTPDGGAGAVDPFGVVHGVAGLRVADTSILPAAPRRGPANTAVLIGELVAQAMRAPAPARGTQERSRNEGGIRPDPPAGLGIA